MKPLTKSLSHLVLALAFTAAGACTSDSPTEPAGGQPATPQPPAPVTAYRRDRHGQSAAALDGLDHAQHGHRARCAGPTTASRRPT